jgi:hypothetical protein
MFKKIILMVITIVVIRGIGYATFPSLNPEPIEQETMTIKVYFNNINLNPNLEDCSKVYSLNRIIPKTVEVAKAALKELFKGPTEEEKSQGYTSWFSKETQDILESVKVKNGTAYVDLKDLRQMIPNASTSCGSAEFFAEVETTLQQFPTVDKVIFAIDGKPATFYEWMQIGCYEENDFCDETPFKTSDRDTEEETKKIIRDRTHEAILAIKNKDTKKLSNLVHPDKGICFSPYSNVELKNNLVFPASQVLNFLQDKKVYTWGIYDGSGLAINLTSAEYYNKFIYDVDFVNAPEISYNRIIGKGSTTNNAFEVYPNTIIVEYHFSGFDPKYEGMDWRSLRLVFEEKDTVWYLIGIIHDQWTI